MPPTIYPTYPRPYKESVLGEPGALSRDALATQAAGYDRVWMVCAHDGTDEGRFDPPVLAALAKSHAILEDKGFPYIHVVRLQKRD